MTKFQDILQRNGVNLIDVVRDSGVDLKKDGNRHVGLCPFHDERNPSFFVYPDEHFHCFGCGKRGHIIEAIKEQRAYRRYGDL